MTEEIAYQILRALAITSLTAMSACSFLGAPFSHTPTLRDLHIQNICHRIRTVSFWLFIFSHFVMTIAFPVYGFRPMGMSLDYCLLLILLSGVGCLCSRIYR